jgi:hypothetical protein
MVDCASVAPQNCADHEVTTVLSFSDPTSAREMALADRRSHDPAHENIRMLPVLLFEEETIAQSVDLARLMARETPPMQRSAHPEAHD